MKAFRRSYRRLQRELPQSGLVSYSTLASTKLDSRETRSAAPAGSIDIARIYLKPCGAAAPKTMAPRSIAAFVASLAAARAGTVGFAGSYVSGGGGPPTPLAALAR